MSISTTLLDRFHTQEKLVQRRCYVLSTLFVLICFENLLLFFKFDYFVFSLVFMYHFSSFYAIKNEHKVAELSELGCQELEEGKRIIMYIIYNV